MNATEKNPSRRSFVKICSVSLTGLLVRPILADDQFPYDMCSQKNQYKLVSYKGIHAEGGKPRFNRVYFQPTAQVCSDVYTKLTEMHPSPNTIASCVFQLPKGTKRIRGKFGMARQDSNPYAIGNFLGIILVDGEKIWEGKVSGNTCSNNPLKIDKSFPTPAFEIEFQVHPDKNEVAHADHAVWLEPTLYDF